MLAAPADSKSDADPKPEPDPEPEPEPEAKNPEPEPEPEPNIFDSLGVTLQELTNPGQEMPALRDYWMLQQPMYSTGDCCLTLAQNFESLVLGLKVQNRSINHPASVFGSFNSNGSVLSLEMEGASTTCLRVFPNENEFPIQSGVDSGIHLLLDLETFDNAHLGVNGDGLKIMVTDNNDFSLLDLNGFTIKPGVSSTIKIRPVLFDATDQALKNFNDIDRRCIDPSNPVVQNILPNMSLPYSLSNCLLGAALEQAHINCPGLGQDREGLMNATGLTLGCLNRHISQVGRWKKVLASDVTCLDSCKRQENKIFVSERSFPNKMFASSEDFFLVIRKLWWSCRPEKNKFGPKRSILETDFPNLCEYYDNFIYPNSMVSSWLNNTKFFPSRPMVTFLKDLNLTRTQLDNFKEEVLAYSKRNLVQITAYVEKVFAVQYMTDQVKRDIFERN